MNRTGILAFVSAGAVAALVGGCVQPGELDPRVIGQYQRSLAQAGPQPRESGPMGLMRPAAVAPGELTIVTDPQTGKTRVLLSLDTAILRALAENTDINVVSYDPSVSYEAMVQAAAEFDYVLQSAWSEDRIDTESFQAIAPGVLIEDTQHVGSYSLGIAKKTITGAQVALAYTMTRTVGSRVYTSTTREWNQNIELDVTQPLLRNAWPQFNLAQLRVARLNYKTSVTEFRRIVEQQVVLTIETYWTLIQTRRNRMIFQEYLDRSVETLNRVEKRRAVDATDVEVLQSQAAVAAARADVIRADKNILDAQDQLARLIGGERLNLLSDYEIVPTTRLNTEEVRIDTADQLLTALRDNPQLAEARLAVEIADISVSVAANQALPALDLTASVTGQGAGLRSGDSWDRLSSADQVGYGLKLALSYPLGNRERLANLRARQLGRLQSISTLQDTADKVAQQVRERARQVRTSYEGMLAQRESVASIRGELDALTAAEELRRLSPEFLQVKLSAQQSLAVAELAEVAATVNYNNAIADLAKATGTVLELQGVELAMPVVIGREAAAAQPRTAETDSGATSEQ
jgi:outer membrane protein TolC